MKYLKSLTILLGVAALGACVKPEVIPKPTYEATLPVSFSGKIEGANLEIIKDYKGYSLLTSQDKENFPSPQPSSITYNSALESEDFSDRVEIRLGKLWYSGSQSQIPSIEDFNLFFTDGLADPLEYKTGANDGVEIIYRDSQGVVYTSSETSADPQDFEITNLESDQDDNGEYMKFVARFNLFLYSDTVPEEADTVEIQDAVFVGYFTR